MVTEKTVLVYPELLVSMVPIYFGFEKRSKEIHEAYSLESRPQLSKSKLDKHMSCNCSNGTNMLLRCTTLELVVRVLYSDQKRAIFLKPHDFDKPSSARHSAKVLIN